MVLKTFKLLKLLVEQCKTIQYPSVKVLQKIGLSFEKVFTFDDNKGVIYKIKFL